VEGDISDTHDFCIEHPSSKGTQGCSPSQFLSDLAHNLVDFAAEEGCAAALNFHNAEDAPGDAVVGAR